MISVAIECSHERGYCDCLYIKKITYRQAKKAFVHKYPRTPNKPIDPVKKSKYNCCVERKMAQSGICTNERINNALCMQSYCPFTCFYSYMVDSCGDCKSF